MQHRRLRGFLGMLIAATGFLGSAPLPAHALTGTTYVRPVYAGGVGGCGKIARDPNLATSSLTAFPSALPRSYAEMTAITIAAGPITPLFGSPQGDFTLTTCTPQPSWPSTASGDAGVEFKVCLDPAQAQAITRTPQVIGHGHDGRPIYDGPYPSSQGWKFCTFADFGVGGGTGGLVDYGLCWWDPIGIPSCVHASNQPDMTRPGWAGNAVNLYFPYTWRWVIAELTDLNPPLDGSAKTMAEPVLGAGDSPSNVVATASASFDAGVPPSIAPNGVCAPTPVQQPACVGGITSITGLLDTIPGTQYCPGVVAGLPEPAVGCINDGLGYDLGLNPVSVPGAQAVPTCADTTNTSGSAGAVTVNGGTVVSSQLLTCDVVAGIYNYNPCQSTQGNGQDKGDLYMLTSETGLPCPVTSVTLPYAYVSPFGRVLGPNTGIANPVGGAPSSNINHVLAQFEGGLSFLA